MVQRLLGFPDAISHVNICRIMSMPQFQVPAPRKSTDLVAYTMKNLQKFPCFSGFEGHLYYSNDHKIQFEWDPSFSNPANVRQNRG